MVGVAHSKACLNCRARKKGCDGQKPSCGRCVHLGLKCHVYRREFRFVQGNSRSLTNRAPQQGSTVAEGESDISLLPTSFLSMALRSHSRGNLWTSFISNDYCTSYERLWLPESMRWIYWVLDNERKNLAMSSALDAIAYARLGRTVNDRILQEYAVSKYFSAMRQLNRVMSTDKEALEDSTLATVLLLGLFEFHHGADGKGNGRGWVAHMKGALNLVKLRGNLNFKSPYAEELLQGCQRYAFIAAICRRRDRTIHSDLPYSRWSPDNKSNYPALPALRPLMLLAEKIRAHKGPSSVIVNEINGLLQKSNVLRRSLIKWHQSYTSQYSVPLFSHEPSRIYQELPVSSPFRLFPSYIHFASLEIAEQIMNYWTTLLLLQMCIGLVALEIYLRFRHSPEITSAIEALRAFGYDPIDQSNTTRNLAYNILSAAEYLAKPESGIYAGAILGFPAAVCRMYFAKTGRENEHNYLLTVILPRFSAFKNIPLATFLQDMEEDSSMNMLKMPSLPQIAAEEPSLALAASHESDAGSILANLFPLH